MNRVFLRNLAVLTLQLSIVHPTPAAADEPNPLGVGIAFHAFEHLGDISDQADAAAASGATIIYTGGFGSLGYEGLPQPDALKNAGKEFAAYVQKARSLGIQLAVGYVCATSIVRLDTFDQNWTRAFRAKFSSPPTDWLQCDRDGKPLPSWYGGDYRPACMNNPDWRTYEHFMVRQQLDAGHDGIFFDNPTVHPQGCYCGHCMKKFAAFLANEGTRLDLPANDPDAFMRGVAVGRPVDFLRFRATTARDFLVDMRSYARTVNPKALITCNNSLNTPDAYFAQCRTHGYNIYEMSKAEDFVVVEDMISQPRTLPDGTTIEYGPVYEMLRAISHDKPVVAVTIAESDYHTPSNLVRLAMAEAAAHSTSYLAWTTWPENVRAHMVSSIRPQADLLRQNAALLNHTEPRADALVVLPFRRWVDTDECPTLRTVRVLSSANMQYQVVEGNALGKRLQLKRPRVLIIESPSVLLEPERRIIGQYKASGGIVISTDDETWLKQLSDVSHPSLRFLAAPPTVRGVVHDQPTRTVVHLLNLNIERLSSFEDKVTSAKDVRFQVRVPLGAARSVTAVTADPQATRGTIAFTQAADDDDGGSLVTMTIPEVSISTILIIE